MIEQQFSLLMCVCAADSPSHFNLALRSVIEHQMKKPDEAVLVVDGEVDSEVFKIIETVFFEIPIDHQVIKNEGRMGLAFSLNRGLEYCSRDWVARMDADDIAMPERFSEQMSYLARNPSVAVLGSSVREFGSVAKERDKVAITEADLIRKNLKFRNPINHPSCIFNRQKVLSVGGYPRFEKNQDYGLWLLLAAKGYELANLNNVLLKFRITDNFYSKRGIRLLKHDLSVLLLQKRLGMASLPMLAILVVLRIIFRVLPSSVLQLLYSASRK